MTHPPTHKREPAGHWHRALCGATAFSAKVVGVRWHHSDKPEKVTCRACLAKLRSQP